MTLAWCPDSTCIVISDAVDEATRVDALFVVSVETGEKRQLTFPAGLALADTDPAVSPDGRWLVFRRDAVAFSGTLQLLPLERGFTAKGEPRAITANHPASYSPKWLSDRTQIIFSAKFSLWRLGIGEGETPERLPFVGEDGIMPVASRPQPGRPARLAYVRSFADINIWRLDTTGPRRSGDVAASYRHLLHSTRRGRGSFSGWPARGLRVRSLG